MIKELRKIAKNKDLEAKIKYERPERDVVAYKVSIYKNNEFVKAWNGGYFIGEVGTSNSKDIVLKDFKDFINALLY